MRSWLHRILAGLAVLIASLAPLGPALAQAPPDVATYREEGPPRALPVAPDDYAREQQGDVVWEYPRQASSVAEDLQAVYRAEWPRVVAELGVEVAPDVVIRIGRNPTEMAALAPVEAPPPAYASGVAYPYRGLILLTLAAPETWERPDVARVLVHELSHIALHRAVSGGTGPEEESGDDATDATERSVPRWFSEGVAIYQAREMSLERTRALWGGTVGGQLMSFDQLSAGFPDRPHQVNLAYAQSADFVRWLRDRDDGERKFREVISRLARGQSFDTSLSRTYSTNLTRLEIDWHADLGERFQAFPLLFGSGSLWVLAAILIVVAYVKRRRRDRAKHREWEAEEEAMRVSAQALLATATAARDDGEPERQDEPIEVLYVIPPEPRVRDSQIPTVEHDGRSHTLH